LTGGAGPCTLAAASATVKLLLDLFIAITSRIPLRLSWALSLWIAWLWWTVAPVRRSAAEYV
jgi:hypothetical protein